MSEQETPQERLLVIAQETEAAQHKLEQQAKTAELGAAIGFVLGDPSGAIFFAQEALNVTKTARLARQVKLLALDKERETRWGGV